jgi:hypothetical protein
VDGNFVAEEWGCLAAKARRPNMVARRPTEQDEAKAGRRAGRQGQGAKIAEAHQGLPEVSGKANV